MREGEMARVSQILLQRDRLPAQRQTPCEVPLLERQKSGYQEGLDPHLRRHVLAARQSALQDVPAFAQIPPCLPEAKEGTAQTQRQRMFALLQQPVQGGTQIGMLVLQPCQPPDLLCTFKIGFDLFRQS